MADSSAALANPIQLYAGQATVASKSSPTIEPPFVISGAATSARQARAVAELLLACRDLPARAVPATELSKEAMARVREKVKEAPLPEGIFYDGRGYIDGFGDWTADHPALEAAVEAEMRALNAEAERCNAALATARGGPGRGGGLPGARAGFDRSRLRSD